MEDYNTPIFAQAKIEYTKQLIDILYIRIYEGIRSIYDETKIIHNKQKTNLHIIYIFRELLEKIPIWNQEIIQKETDRIIQVSKCDWFDDLITAVFISHTKILTSIGPNNSFNKINITIPKTTTFIHKIYINIAREIWKNPYLFNEEVLGHEYQRNTKEIETIIKDCIEGTIRDLLPIKEILREHLETYDTNDNTMNNMKEIKKMLREELETITKQTINESTNQNDNKEEKDNHLDQEDINKDQEDNHEDHEEIDNKNYDFSSDIETLFDTNDDPSDEIIQEQCKDIIVNDITVPVDEEKYDNVDIINDSSEITSTDKVDRLLNTMKSNIIHSEPIHSEPIQYESNNNIKEYTQTTNANPTISLFNDLDNNKSTMISPQGIQDSTHTEINKEPYSTETNITKEPETNITKEPETNITKEPETNITKEPETEIKKEPDSTETDIKKEPDIDMKKDIKIEMPTETKSKKSLYPNLHKKNNSTSEINITKIDEEKEMKEFSEPVINKEVVAFDKSDNEDTQTLDNFFSDIKDIMDKKDIPIHDNDNKMILFSDADDF